MKEKNLIVLIAHYNNPEGLRKSILSIQENIAVDVLVVDDGSKELFDEEELRASYKCGEIFFEYLEKNSGVGVAANRGLEVIQEFGYKLIGRLDCGDLCLPHKYEKQLSYLKKNPDVKALGTWANMVNEKGELQYILKHPTSYEEIKRKMYLNSMFINPTTVFYTEILDVVGKYPYKYRRAAQDYAFFFNVIEKYKAENLPEALLDYVIEDGAISTKKRKLQVKNRILIILEHFNYQPYTFYSLFRNSILYFLPRTILEKAKSYMIK